MSQGSVRMLWSSAQHVPGITMLQRLASRVGEGVDWGLGFHSCYLGCAAHTNALTAALIDMSKGAFETTVTKRGTVWSRRYSIGIGVNRPELHPCLCHCVAEYP